jgi:hypothetical protein
MRRPICHPLAAAVIAALSILGAATAAVAYWTAGGSGSATAAAATAQAMTATAGTPTTALYPGGLAGVALTVSNPNPFTARVGSLSLDPDRGVGGFAVDSSHSGCGLSALTFTPQTNGGKGWWVPPKIGSTNGTSAIDLLGALAMDLNAATACQGANFTVYLTASPDYATTILATTGLVGYWRMGGGPAATDDFTDSPGVALQARTGRGTAGWTRAGGLDAVVTGADRLRRSGGDHSLYYASAIPMSADYAVQADVVVESIIVGDAIGVAGRLAPATGDHYAARYDTADTSWNLLRYSGGTGTKLASVTGQPLTAEQTYRMRLDLRGSTITLYVNDVATVTATDSAYPTGGKAGVRLGIEGGNVPITDASGLHLDNFRLIYNTGATVADAGANALAGTFVGSPLLNVPGALAGDDNGAARWNGTDSYASIPDADALHLGDTFTLETWVKRADTATGRQTMLHKGAGSFQLVFDNNRFALCVDAGGKLAESAAAQLDTTSFHHYVATKNGSSVRVYVDGVDVTSPLTSYPSGNTTIPLAIGSTNGTADFLYGVQDEVAVYNVALDASTVSSHYLLGRGI